RLFGASNAGHLLLSGLYNAIGGAPDMPVIWNAPPQLVEPTLVLIDEFVDSILPPERKRTEAAMVATPSSELARHTPPVAIERLFGWRDICKAVGMKSSDKRKLEAANKKFNGPIRQGGQGESPIVNRSELIEWWNGLERQFADAAAKEKDAAATVRATH